MKKKITLIIDNYKKKILNICHNYKHELICLIKERKIISTEINKQYSNNTKKNYTSKYSHSIKLNIKNNIHYPILNQKEKIFIPFITLIFLSLILFGCDNTIDGTKVKSEEDAIKYAEIAKNNGDFFVVEKSAVESLSELSDGSKVIYSYLVKYRLDGTIVKSVCVTFAGKATIFEGDIKSCPIPEEYKDLD